MTIAKKNVSKLCIIALFLIQNKMDSDFFTLMCQRLPQGSAIENITNFVELLSASETEEVREFQARCSRRLEACKMFAVSASGLKESSLDGVDYDR